MTAGTNPSTATPSLDGIGWLFVVFGGLFAASGLWGMFASAHWYETIARDTGPLNVHFVRDIGEAYGTVGFALLWGAFVPRWRAPLCTVATLFLGLHAVGHVYELLVGELPAHHWLEDLPGVFLPALLFGALTFHLLRRAREEI